MVNGADNLAGFQHGHGLDLEPGLNAHAVVLCFFVQELNGGLIDIPLVIGMLGQLP